MQLVILITQSIYVVCCRQSQRTTTSHLQDVTTIKQFY